MLHSDVLGDTKYLDRNSCMVFPGSAGVSPAPEAAKMAALSGRAETVKTTRLRHYSHVLFLKPRLVAFSEMARLMWSETPSGKSAVISTLTFTVA